SLNQGNFLHGGKGPRPPTSTQKPCWDTLVTSTSKMPLPRSTDLTFVPPDKVESARQVSWAHAVVSGHLDLRFEPELRFPVCVMDVDVGSRLLTREKVEAIATDRKSTRLNSSHGSISYAVFCLKKKKKNQTQASGLPDSVPASRATTSTTDPRSKNAT